jgi:hypothetical protein
MDRSEDPLTTHQPQQQCTRYALRNQRDATFDLDISQYVSTVVPAKSGSKTKPASSFACTVLDSPRYQKYGKPVPYARRYVSVTGFLTDTIFASESEPRKIKKFFVEVDNIVFGPAGSATVTTLANGLDSESLLYFACPTTLLMNSCSTP